MMKILERKEDLKKRESARALFIKIYYAIRRKELKFDSSNIAEIPPKVGDGKVQYIQFNTTSDDSGVSKYKSKYLNMIHIGCKTLFTTTQNPLVIFDKQQSAIIHEIIHIETYHKKDISFATQNNMTVDDIRKYVNSPEEWEAFFQQTSHLIDEALADKHIQWFNNTYPDYQSFETYFFSVLDNKVKFYVKPLISEEMMKKWRKRIYQFYNECLNKLDKTHEVYYNTKDGKESDDMITKKVKEEVERNPEAYSLVEARSLDYAVVYAISNRFCMPLKKWKAYKLGIIDEKGNILRPLKSDEDRKAFTPLDNVCVRIKRLIPQHLWYLLTFTQIFKGFVTYSTYKSYYESAKSQDDLLKIEEKRLSIMRAKKQLDEIVKNNPNFTEEEFWSHVASAEDIDNG